jgi:hypothetical protein
LYRRFTILSATFGQLVGIRSGEKTPGNVEEENTEDSLNVKVSTAEDIFWGPVAKRTG